MQLPMVGSWVVQIHAVKPFTIHGDVYYELHVTRNEEPQRGIAIRVPQHAAVSPPQAGERVEITFLMGQVTAVRTAI
jgi:hypothetical protein